MAGPGAAAEELPVLVGLYLTVSAIVVWLLLRALKLAWTNTLGALLLALGHLLQYHKGPIDISWGNYFFDLDTKIEIWMRDEIAAQEFAIGWFWHQTAHIQGWLAHETWALARDAFHFGGWLVHTYIPTFVHGVTNIYHTATRTVVKQVTRVEHVTTTLGRTILIPHAGELAWIHKHWKALTTAVLGAATLPLNPGLTIPRLWKEVRTFNRRWEIHNRRLKRLEALFGAAAMAAVLANTFGLGTNWRCITRGNIGRFMRALCGAPSWILDVFLLSAFTAFTVLDLCDFIAAEVKLAEWLQPLLMDFVDVDEWLIKNCKYTKAPDLTLPALSLPPFTGVTLNAERDFVLGLAS